MSKILIIVAVLISSINLYCCQWGPFDSCGNKDKKPTDKEDCFKYHLKTGIDCCLFRTKDEVKDKVCAYVGGNMKNYFNTNTNFDKGLLMSFKNFDIPNNYVNRGNYTEKYINDTRDKYGILADFAGECENDEFEVLNSPYLKYSFMLVAISYLIFFE